MRLVEGTTAIATLIFAAMAGIGSMVRVCQNERFYRWHKKNHRRK